MILESLGKIPQISAGAFIAPTATVVGDVVIGEGTSVWYNTVIRGDNAPVRIGCHTSIQDNACVHDRTRIGDYVTIGHGAIVHGCTVGNDVLIGMGAIILDGATIGDNAIIAAGAVVKSGTAVPPGVLFAGNPAVWKKDLAEGTVRENREHAEYYSRLGEDYLRSQKEVRQYVDV